MANPQITMTGNHRFQLTGFPRLVSSHQMEIRLWDKATGAKHASLFGAFAEDFDLTEYLVCENAPVTLVDRVRFRLKGNKLVSGTGMLRNGGYVMRVKALVPSIDKPTNLYFFDVVRGRSVRNERDAKFEDALALDASGAQLYLDFYAPALSEMVAPDSTFKLDSIVPVASGTPARACLRTGTGELICYIPFLFKPEFRLKDILQPARHTVLFNQRARDVIDFDRNQLRDGEYKISVVTTANGATLRSRDHGFRVVSERLPARERSGRVFCTLPWRDLTLREYGSMPCCDLNRNEHLLYNVHTDGIYDPWNNASWKSLRESLVEGDARYCNPSCPNLTVEKPESLEKFVTEGLYPNEADKLRYEAYLKGDVELAAGPSRLSIMVGTVCNIDCIFCPIPFLRNDRTILTDSKLDLLKKHIPQARVLAFTGGEPMVYLKELRKLEHLFHENLKLQIITNGISMDKLATFGTRSQMYVRVSLNVASRESYVYLHEKDFFDRIVSNMRVLKEKRPEAVLSPKFIVMRSTVSEIVAFAKICIDVGADECCFTTLWLKEQSKIDPDEKLGPSDAEWDEANEALAIAQQMVEAGGLKFLFSGWEKRPDDDLSARRAAKAQGEDHFEWAEA